MKGGLRISLAWIGGGRVDKFAKCVLILLADVAKEESEQSSPRLSSTTNALHYISKVFKRRRSVGRPALLSETPRRPSLDQSSVCCGGRPAGSWFDALVEHPPLEQVLRLQMDAVPQTATQVFLHCVFATLLWYLQTAGSIPGSEREASASKPELDLYRGPRTQSRPQTPGPGLRGRPPEELGGDKTVLKNCALQSQSLIALTNHVLHVFSLLQASVIMEVLNEFSPPGVGGGWRLWRGSERREEASVTEEEDQCSDQLAHIQALHTYYAFRAASLVPDVVVTGLVPAIAGTYVIPDPSWNDLIWINWLVVFQRYCRKLEPVAGPGGIEAPSVLVREVHRSVYRTCLQIVAHVESLLLKAASAAEGLAVAPDDLSMAQTLRNLNTVQHLSLLAAGCRMLAGHGVRNTTSAPARALQAEATAWAVEVADAFVHVVPVLIREQGTPRVLMQSIGCLEVVFTALGSQLPLHRCALLFRKWGAILWGLLYPRLVALEPHRIPSGTVHDFMLCRGVVAYSGAARVLNFLLTFTVTPCDSDTALQPFAIVNDTVPNDPECSAGEGTQPFSDALICAGIARAFAVIKPSAFYPFRQMSCLYEASRLLSTLLMTKYSKLRPYTRTPTLSVTRSDHDTPYGNAPQGAAPPGAAPGGATPAGSTSQRATSQLAHTPSTCCSPNWTAPSGYRCGSYGGGSGYSPGGGYSPDKKVSGPGGTVVSWLTYLYSVQVGLIREMLFAPNKSLYFRLVPQLFDEVSLLLPVVFEAHYLSPLDVKNLLSTLKGALAYGDSDTFELHSGKCNLSNWARHQAVCVNCSNKERNILSVRQIEIRNTHHHNDLICDCGLWLHRLRRAALNVLNVARQHEQLNARDPEVADLVRNVVQMTIGTALNIDALTYQSVVHLAAHFKNKSISRLIYERSVIQLTNAIRLYRHHVKTVSTFHCGQYATALSCIRMHGNSVPDNSLRRNEWLSASMPQLREDRFVFSLEGEESLLLQSLAGLAIVAIAIPDEWDNVTISTCFQIGSSHKNPVTRCQGLLTFLALQKHLRLSTDRQSLVRYCAIVEHMIDTALNDRSEFVRQGFTTLFRRSSFAMNSGLMPTYEMFKVIFHNEKELIGGNFLGFDPPVGGNNRFGKHSMGNHSIGNHSMGKQFGNPIDDQVGGIQALPGNTTGSAMAHPGTIAIGAITGGTVSGGVLGASGGIMGGGIMGGGIMGGGIMGGKKVIDIDMSGWHQFEIPIITQVQAPSRRIVTILVEIIRGLQLARSLPSDHRKQIHQHHCKLIQIFICLLVTNSKQISRTVMTLLLAMINHVMRLLLRVDRQESDLTSFGILLADAHRYAYADENRELDAFTLRMQRTCPELGILLTELSPVPCEGICGQPATCSIVGGCNIKPSTTDYHSAELDFLYWLLRAARAMLNVTDRRFMTKPCCPTFGDCYARLRQNRMLFGRRCSLLRLTTSGYGTSGYGAADDTAGLIREASYSTNPLQRSLTSGEPKGVRSHDQHCNGDDFTGWIWDRLLSETVTLGISHLAQSHHRLSSVAALRHTATASSRAVGELSIMTKACKLLIAILDHLDDWSDLFLLDSFDILQKGLVQLLMTALCVVERLKTGYSKPTFDSPSDADSGKHNVYGDSGNGLYGNGQSHSGRSLSGHWVDGVGTVFPSAAKFVAPPFNGYQHGEGTASGCFGEDLLVLPVIKSRYRDLNATLGETLRTSIETLNVIVCRLIGHLGVRMKAESMDAATPDCFDNRAEFLLDAERQANVTTQPFRDGLRGDKFVYRTLHTLAYCLFVTKHVSTDSTVLHKQLLKAFNIIVDDISIEIQSCDNWDELAILKPAATVTFWGALFMLERLWLSRTDMKIRAIRYTRQLNAFWEPSLYQDVSLCDKLIITHDTKEPVGCLPLGLCWFGRENITACTAGLEEVVSALEDRAGEIGCDISTCARGCTHACEHRYSDGAQENGPAAAEKPYTHDDELRPTDVGTRSDGVRSEVGRRLGRRFTEPDCGVLTVNESSGEELGEAAATLWSSDMALILKEINVDVQYLTCAQPVVRGRDYQVGNNPMSTLVTRLLIILYRMMKEKAVDGRYIPGQVECHEIHYQIVQLMATIFEALAVFRVQDDQFVYPLSSILSIADQGLFLGICRRVRHLVFCSVLSPSGFVLLQNQLEPYLRECLAVEKRLEGLIKTHCESGLSNLSTRSDPTRWDPTRSDPARSDPCRSDPHRSDGEGSVSEQLEIEENDLQAVACLTIFLDVRDAFARRKNKFSVYRYGAKLTEELDELVQSSAFRYLVSLLFEELKLEFQEKESARAAAQTRVWSERKAAAEVDYLELNLEGRQQQTLADWLQWFHDWLISICRSTKSSSARQLILVSDMVPIENSDLPPYLSRLNLNHVVHALAPILILTLWQSIDGHLARRRFARLLETLCSCAPPEIKSVVMSSIELVVHFDLTRSIFNFGYLAEAAENIGRLHAAVFFKEVELSNLPAHAAMPRIAAIRKLARLGGALTQVSYTRGLTLTLNNLMSVRKDADFGGSSGQQECQLMKDCQEWEKAAQMYSSQRVRGGDGLADLENVTRLNHYMRCLCEAQNWIQIVDGVDSDLWRAIGSNMSAFMYSSCGAPHQGLLHPNLLQQPGLLQQPSAGILQGGVLQGNGLPASGLPLWQSPGKQSSLQRALRSPAQGGGGSRNRRVGYPVVIGASPYTRRSREPHVPAEVQKTLPLKASLDSYCGGPGRHEPLQFAEHTRSILRIRCLAALHLHQWESLQHFAEGFCAAQRLCGSLGRGTALWSCSTAAEEEETTLRNECEFFKIISCYRQREFRRASSLISQMCQSTAHQLGVLANGLNNTVENATLLFIRCQQLDELAEMIDYQEDESLIYRSWSKRDMVSAWAPSVAEAIVAVRNVVGVSHQSTAHWLQTLRHVRTTLSPNTQKTTTLSLLTQQREINADLLTEFLDIMVGCGGPDALLGVRGIYDVMNQFLRYNSHTAPVSPTNRQLLGMIHHLILPVCLDRTADPHRGTESVLNPPRVEYRSPRSLNPHCWLTQENLEKNLVINDANFNSSLVKVVKSHLKQFTMISTTAGSLLSSRRSDDSLIIRPNHHGQYGLLAALAWALRVIDAHDAELWQLYATVNFCIVRSQSKFRLAQLEHDHDVDHDLELPVVPDTDCPLCQVMKVGIEQEKFGHLLVSAAAVPVVGTAATPSGGGVAATAADSSATSSCFAITDARLLHCACEAIKGFTNCVKLSTSESCRGKWMWNTLYIIFIWFAATENLQINDLVQQLSQFTSPESWFTLLPQLLSRFSRTRPVMAATVRRLLTILSHHDPNRLIFPLTVSANNVNADLAEPARDVLTELAICHRQLSVDCRNFIDSSKKVAVLFCEAFLYGIEVVTKALNEDGPDAAVQQLKELLLDIDKRATPSTIAHYSAQLVYIKHYLQEWTANPQSRDWLMLKKHISSLYRLLRNRCPDQIQITEVAPELVQKVDWTISVPGKDTRMFGVLPEATIFKTKRRPKKIRILGVDGCFYVYLLKAHEDLRQDQRALQLLSLFNELATDCDETVKRYVSPFASMAAAAVQDFGEGDPGTTIPTIEEPSPELLTYSVVPLPEHMGFVSWLKNTDTIHELICQYRRNLDSTKDPAHEMRLSNSITKHFENLPFNARLNVLKTVYDETGAEDLREMLLGQSTHADTNIGSMLERWLKRRANYSRSLAAMSCYGYILGLGDRHCSNIMIDRDTGLVVHIDFGDCFESAMLRKRFPERVPFRLTRMLLKALGPTGHRGIFQASAVRRTELVRQHQELLYSILDTIVFDPLTSWNALLRQMHEIRCLARLPRESDQVKTESSDLVLCALYILERCKAKIAGTERGSVQTVEEQVERLIGEATDPANLCRAYIGWNPFW
ncbi:phosphatidylinositol 3- and 4-kinase [Gregarina niphandrodes]|uniref:non-specific serine/threonine protein kinase n=1 Tax=Gregarina niphandrodes TaxID=110365 RepID=A0A023B4F7_GRENI|nr:phosphatidylinositol 3- and 4-kinase [Gregarina niphandrodes]EZG56717.1 phosphatidylinositol 3- and 4-kinase [Gregarina niphandrodes]|eukprot:XP_011131185.1 phosphatidylinositol 3- and 4-kinase [Gregarina niphandrodes]